MSGEMSCFGDEQTYKAALHKRSSARFLLTGRAIRVPRARQCHRQAVPQCSLAASQILRCNGTSNKTFNENVVQIKNAQRKR